MNVKLSHTTAPCQILRCALTLWVPICVTVNKDTEKSMVHVKVWTVMEIVYNMHESMYCNMIQLSLRR